MANDQVKFEVNWGDTEDLQDPQSKYGEVLNLERLAGSFYLHTMWYNHLDRFVPQEKEKKT